MNASSNKGVQPSAVDFVKASDQSIKLSQEINSIKAQPRSISKEAFRTQKAGLQDQTLKIQANQKMSENFYMSSVKAQDHSTAKRMMAQDAVINKSVRLETKQGLQGFLNQLQGK